MIKKSKLRSKMNILVILILLITYLIGLNYDLEIFNYTWVFFSLFILHIIITTGVDLIKEKKANIPLFVFFVFYFILIILEPVMSIVNTGETSYILKFGQPKNSSLMISGVSHSLFVLVILSFQNFKQTSIRGHNFLKAPQLNFKLTLSLIIFTLIGLYPYFRDGLEGFIQTIILSRSENNSQFKITGMANADFAVHLATILISVGSICGYYLTYSNSKKLIYKIILFFLLTITIVVVGSSGTRTRIILLIIPIISFILFIKSKKIKKIKTKKIILLSIGGIILLSFMAQFRKIGFANISSKETTSLNFDGLDLNNEFIYTIENFEKPINARNFFQTLFYPIPEQIIKFVTNPLPRKFFPNKYLDPSFAPYNIKRIGYSGLNKTFNITPTIFGRFYILYGFVGIIYVSILIGYSLTKINNNLENSHNLFTIFLNFCFLAFICQSIRDLSPGWLYAFVFTLIIFKFFRYFKIDD